LNAWQTWLAGLQTGKNPCYRCRKNGNDRSGNNYHHYGEGKGGYCHACGLTQLSDDEKVKRGVEDVEEQEEWKIDFMAKVFTEEDHKELKKITTFEGKGYRNISKETYQYFAVRHEYFEDGTLEVQYYPNTKAGTFCGYKARKVATKEFYAFGELSNDCDLFGQFRFLNASGKYVVIAAGEVDCLSAYQMLENHRIQRGSQFDPIPVVSPTNGETGSHKQLQKHYEWFDRFTQIVLCYDNDDAGRKAAEEAIKVLPKGKVHLMKLTRKDTNAYIWDNNTKSPLSFQQEWINAFYKAEKYYPQGITSSANLEEKMREYVSIPRLSLPPFMHKMQKMLAGGFPIGYIINILSASGTGKSTFVDAMILHWIMNDSRMVGIVSLEASEGEYGVNLSSSFCGMKINLLETPEEKLAYLDQPENIAKRQELWLREDGSPRFYLVDAEIETMKQKIEYLIRGLGCKIIVLDPLQDIFDALDDDQQAKWMKWEKDIVKKEQVTIININHSRKSGQGQKANSKGADLSEEDMMGHSSIFKSGGINIILMRNKEAETEDERNTTIAKITKARGVGRTGVAGEYFYENTTHRIFDKEDYFTGNRPSGF
jgi:KaiC/GvpD/RAD55 family RecA-like ATPase